MTSGSDGKWTLRVGTHESGPFTLEEVRGLYLEGEILGQHHATSPQLGGRWVEVRSLFPGLVADLTHEKGLGQTNSSRIPATPPRGDVNSALSLLETLQSVRDKQSAPPPPLTPYVPPNDRDWMGMIKQLSESRWVQAALAVFCLGMGLHLVLSRWRVPEVAQPVATPSSVVKAPPKPLPSRDPAPQARPSSPPSRPQITVSVPGQPSRTLPVERTEPRVVQPQWQTVQPSATPRYRGTGPARVPPRLAIDPNTLVPPVEGDDEMKGADRNNAPESTHDGEDRDENGNYRGLIDPNTPPMDPDDSGGT